MPRSTRTLAALAVVLLAALASTATATATPPSGVTAETLVQFTVPGELGSSDSPTVVTIRRIEIDPGGTTGWHFHDGPVYGVVAAGALTRTLHDCSEQISRIGEFVDEVVGSDHTHVGFNREAEPLVLFVTYLSAPGVPLASDAPAAC
ncbi:cupin domain-containing protein [Rhodococcus triatomae]|uniref:Cupin domain protein n=1 Tax=Rhodococcus triatomae TaxID=300028 RepID=A0A1G8P2D5_9NOCA|nr:hypothetical protein [Rhodococcus triatomae]QNG18767.1 cupin domain-containing protein [Rhodococcus triatomae]QNG25322.1 cupin domain-containing protein [Rhodococcus triatomae]SDI86637.1 Cupin domain protein [Rhodococcus triatomae]